MRQTLAVMATLMISGCALVPSCAPSPAPEDVERTYDISSDCFSGGTARIEVTGLVVDHRVDCPSGCFCMARAGIVQLSGDIHVTGRWESYCGDDPGELLLWLTDDAGDEVWCPVGLDEEGRDVQCERADGTADAGCFVRVTEAQAP